MTGKESGDDMETIIETLRPVCNIKKLSFQMNQKLSNTSSHDIVSSICKKRSKSVILVFVLRKIREIRQFAN